MLNFADANGCCSLRLSGKPLFALMHKHCVKIRLCSYLQTTKKETNFLTYFLCTIVEFRIYLFKFFIFHPTNLLFRSTFVYFGHQCLSKFLVHFMNYFHGMKTLIYTTQLSQSTHIILDRRLNTELKENLNPHKGSLPEFVENSCFDNMKNFA